MSLRKFIGTPMPVKTKICVYCHVAKPLVCFAKHISHWDNLDTRCSDCIAERRAELRELRKTAPEPPEVCECCGKLPTSGNLSNQSLRPVSLVLDHDKKTKKFRGWLCNTCNTAIGALGDSIEGVENALRYLQRHYTIDPSDEAERFDRPKGLRALRNQQGHVLPL